MASSLSIPSRKPISIAPRSLFILRRTSCIRRALIFARPPSRMQSATSSVGAKRSDS
ncbi:MAG: hypothetical protein A4E43_00802 [Methanosaeta sp. PtaB.Bin005]|nr:MAG: hypothetical protein A4E43_00802 [Methanosaeta sp. PtaB.Bin005]